MIFTAKKYSVPILRIDGIAPGEPKYNYDADNDILEAIIKESEKEISIGTSKGIECYFSVIDNLGVDGTINGFKIYDYKKRREIGCIFDIPFFLDKNLPEVPLNNQDDIRTSEASQNQNEKAVEPAGREIKSLGILISTQILRGLKSPTLHNTKLSIME